MINNIKLQSFKSFYDHELPLESLTVLTGLNSTGKSSVIQSVQILKKAFNNEINLLLDEHGTARELQNQYATDPIKFGVTIDGEEFEVTFPDNSELYDNTIFPQLWYISASRFGPKLSIPIFNDEEKKHIIGENGENVLQCIRHYDVNEPIALHESLIHPDAGSSRTLLTNIRAWLKVISPNVEFAYEVHDIIDSSHATFNGYRSTNVGFGLSYILPVIIALLTSTLTENNLLIIENPEAHLHPKGQTELAKLICLCAEAGTQVIIETHSDHIFNGIRIYSKNSSTNFFEKVLIHWFELNEKKNTEITTLELDKSGRLLNWPAGFFDQFEINSASLL